MICRDSKGNPLIGGMYVKRTRHLDRFVKMVNNLIRARGGDSDGRFTMETVVDVEFKVQKAIDTTVRIEIPGTYISQMFDSHNFEATQMNLSDEDLNKGV